MNIFYVYYHSYDDMPIHVSDVIEEFVEQKDNVHQVFRVNRENGKLATVYTPPELVEERIYVIYPPVANDWVRENDIPQPPTEYDDSTGPAVNLGPVAIISPRPYEYVKGGVVISGNAQIDGFQLPVRIRQAESIAIGQPVRLAGIGVGSCVIEDDRVTEGTKIGV